MQPNTPILGCVRLLLNEIQRPRQDWQNARGHVADDLTAQGFADSAHIGPLPPSCNVIAAAGDLPLQFFALLRCLCFLRSRSKPDDLAAELANFCLVLLCKTRRIAKV